MLKCMILILVFLTKMSFSAQTLKVGADDWQGYAQQDGGGIYFELLKHIYVDHTLDFKIDIYNRTLAAFEKNKIDIVVGVLREDIEQGLFPNWYLDNEYPVFAFYDSRFTKIEQLLDLEDLSTGWLRGYRFDRFIPNANAPYTVDHFENGFDMLIKRRFDVFVDYAYNVPEKYTEHLSKFEILPSRHLYAVFQPTEQGQKLAALFDKKMLELRNSGELKKIFAKEYSYAEFESFDHNKKKIIILTDEVDAIRAMSKTSKNEIIGVGQIIKLAINQLNQYNIELRLISKKLNIEDHKMEQNSCISNARINIQQENRFIVSKPLSLMITNNFSSKHISSGPNETTSGESNSSEFSLGYMMCSRSALGQAFIADFNQVMLKLYKQEVFYNALVHSIADSEQAKFLEYFKQTFATK